MSSANRSNPDSHTPRFRRAFSLTEVLLAIATIAVGMLFIAGVFPVAIHFSNTSAERTIAAAAADEAFAKIQLYSLSAAPPDNAMVPFELINTSIADANVEAAYPSTGGYWYQKKYFWSALCRRVPGMLNDVQVVVFVSRKPAPASTYYDRLDPIDVMSPFRHVAGFPAPLRPMPVKLAAALSPTGRADELTIGVPAFVNAGSTIVDDATGQIYRVLERYDFPNLNVIRLDRPWQGGALVPQGYVWTIPSPIDGGRNPCIAVYQKTMRF